MTADKKAAMPPCYERTLPALCYYLADMLEVLTPLKDRLADAQARVADLRGRL